MDKTKLEEQFNQAMLELYRKVKEAYRPPNYLLGAINDRGGFEVARVLLEKPLPSETFTALQQIGRLDLSVEALVLDNRWRELFEQKHLDMAERRLKSCGFDPYKKQV